MKWLYRNILKPILFLLDPEFVHNLFVRFGAFCGKSKVGRSMIRFFMDTRENQSTKLWMGLLTHHR